MTPWTCDDCGEQSSVEPTQGPPDGWQGALTATSDRARCRECRERLGDLCGACGGKGSYCVDGGDSYNEIDCEECNA